MTSPILVAVDPKRDDPAPLALGLRLARTAGTPLLLTAIYPVQGADRLHPELLRALHSDAEDALLRAAKQVGEAPGPTPPIEVRPLAASRSPAHALHELAMAEEPLLLVLGSSSRSQIGRVFPGAVTDRLLHGAPCPVAVAPGGYSLESVSAPLRTVGAAYVDAPDGQAALTAATALARAAGAYLRLFVVMRARDLYVTAAPVIPPFEHEEARRRDAEAELQHGLSAAGSQIPSTGEVLDGEPATALAAASADLGLLVCGARGFGPLRTIMLGGTSHALVRRAACPVLVVPRGTEATLSAAWRAAAAGLAA
jgi:nucleotide-binding universal stress UspA family protein